MRHIRALQTALQKRYPEISKLTSKLTSAAATIALLLISTGIFLTGDILNPTNAEAVSTAQINVGATSVRVGQANNLGISLSNFSSLEQTGDYQVTLKYVDANGVEQSNGNLSATQGSTTLISGYTSYTATKLGFKGSYSAINTALQSVTWTPGSASSGLTLRIGLATLPGTNKFYDANSGHFYEYVSTAQTWNTAKTTAESKTLFGLKGYLAHITSFAENEFVAKEMTAPSIWIGATDAASEGQWRWSGATITGESDFVFNTYSSAETQNSSIPNSSAAGWGYSSWYSGRYAGWASGEPNNWGGSEDCAVTNWGGGSGSWNDLSCSSTAAYLIEYGGAGGTLDALSITKNASMGASNALATWTSPTSPSSASTQDFGLSFNYDISGLSSADIINAGTAQGCVFKPSVSSALASSTITVTASNCLVGTAQPKLLENSVTVSGGLVIPAATATAINIIAGPAAALFSSVSLSSTWAEVNSSSLLVYVTPRDAHNRDLGSGKTVTVTSSLGTAFVIDNGNGTYTATISPGSTTGASLVGVSVGGAVIASDLGFSVGSRPNLSTLSSTVSVDYNTLITPFSLLDSVGIPTPTYRVSTGALPTGLSLDTATGEISGTPTASGLFTYKISATNRFGTSESANLTLAVNRAPTFVGGDEVISQTGVSGTAYSSNVSASSVSYPSPTYTISSGNLPSGLSLTSSGVIQGTPATSGIYSFRISASNLLGVAETSLLTIQINTSPIVVDDSISLTGYISQPYSAFPIFYGYPDLSYSIGTGALPTGLGLNPSTGEISGTPTQAGDFTFKVRATNIAGFVDSRSYTVHINGAPVYSSTSVPSTTVFGSTFTGSVTFSSYVNAYEVISCGCTVSGSTYDQLPPGISFDTATGSFSGNSTAVGTYKFKVRAYSMNHAVYTDSAVQTVEVRSAPVWFDESTLNEVRLGSSYSDGVSAVSYPAASYSITGTLPTGMSFVAATGAVTGTPTAKGDYTFSITATNVVGSITKNLTLRVFQLPYFSTDGQQVLGQIALGAAYSDEVISLGFPAPTYSVLTNALPPGLQINSATGAITGTPTATGSYDFVIRALNTYGNDDTLSRNITVGSTPAVSSQLTNLVGYVSASYSGSATFTGYPAPTYSITNGALPAGLIIDSTTGVISGSPTESGDFTFSIRATNFVGSATTSSYSMHVYNAPIFANSNSLPSTTTLGSSYSGSVSFTSFVDSYAVVSCGCLTVGGVIDDIPAGLSINSATGVISGTSTATGTYKFKVRAYSMNHAIFGESATVTIEVRQAPSFVDSTISTLVGMGDAYSDGVSVVSYPAATYSISDPHYPLPTGIELNSTTGALTGTPEISGDFTFTITASNVIGSVNRTFTLRVSEHSHFTSEGQAVSKQAVIGSNYIDGVVSLGFPEPTYSLDSGSLPTGLSLNATTGAITGTPNATGSYSFVIRAHNAFGDDLTDTRHITIGSVPAVTENLSTLIGYVGNSYSDSASFSGYPLPTFALASGSHLPAGLEVNSATGVVYGTPTSAGDFTFAITATNFAGSATTHTYTLHVNAEPVFRDASIPATVNLGDNYTGSSRFFGPVYRYNLVSCGCDVSSPENFDGLPEGFTLNASDGQITGTTTVAGTYHFKIRAWSPGEAHFSETPLQTIEVRMTPTWTDQQLNLTAPLNANYHDAVAVVSYPAATYSAVGSLPSGLSIDRETGAITGEPTTPGTYNFAIRATNVIGTATTSQFSLVVSQAPVAVDSVIATEALRNSAFSDGINFTAYPAPTFSIASGALPAGLVLNSETGAITGLPTALGAYTFTIGINAGSYYSYTTSSFNLNIEQAPMATDSTIAAIASVGKSYTDAVAVESFPAATFAITSGSLPRGLTLDSITGAITGSTTETGEFPFTITATNVRGSKLIPLTLSSREAPSKPQVTLASSMTLGESLEGTTTVTGYPAPTFSVVNGALPAGLSLNRINGRISGTPTEAGNFTFSIAATNDQGTSTSAPVSLAIAAPAAQIEIKVSVGEPALGAPVSVASEGLEPNTGYTVTVRSDPQVVGSGRTSRLGEILAKVKIPDNLEPGWHSITLETTGADGKPLKEVAWFEITATGLLEDVQPEEPTSSEKKSALTDDNKFYEEIGIDPGTQVEPEAVASTVQEVSSVVASVALVSAAAAATAAVASAASAAAAAAGASAAAGSAASAGASGSMSSGGGSSPTRAPAGSGSTGSGSSTSGGSSSSSARAGAPSGGGTTVAAAGPDGDGGDGGEGADYGNLEADHDDFTVEHTSWGDRLAWWTTPFMTFMDKISVEATEHTSKISPVFSRIVNDGAYLRAMFGGVMAVPYLVALTLGALSVDVHAKSLAGAGNVALLSIILILGTLDAFAGLLGIISFAVVSISIFGIHSLGDVRYLLAMTIAAFAPIILSTTFRKIRRPHAETLSDVWERVIDVFMIAFVASLATLSVVGGISSFAGATVPLANNAKNLVFVITGVALARILLEEFAARAFPGRLDRINPTEVSGAGTLQQWISLVFKYAVLVVMIGDMVGWGWWLWTGALIMFVPGIIGMTFQDLPKSRLLTQIIPGGLAALLLATLLSSWSGDLVGAVLKGSDMYGPLSFLLVPLPVIIVAIVGMFADGGDKWYIERNLKWVYVVGGIGVFISTVWATDFIGQIFG